MTARRPVAGEMEILLRLALLALRALAARTGGEIRIPHAEALGHAEKQVAVYFHGGFLTVRAAQVIENLPTASQGLKLDGVVPGEDV